MFEYHILIFINIIAIYSLGLFNRCFSKYIIRGSFNFYVRIDNTPHAHIPDLKD